MLAVVDNAFTNQASGKRRAGVAGCMEQTFLWVQNCFGFVFSVLDFFFGSVFLGVFVCYVQHFGAGSCHFNCLCNILELDLLIFHKVSNILVEFVTFWRWKLPFQRYVRHS